MARFHLSILTPDGEVFGGTVTSLVAPGEEGYLGVLANHAPMLAGLRPGSLEVRQDDTTLYFAVGEGSIEVADNNVLVLADYAETAHSLESARSKAAKTSSA